MAVPNDALESFLEELKKFSESHGFATRIAPITPDGKQFGIQMYREDIKALGNNALDNEEIFIGFYQNNGHPIPDSYLKELIQGLKRAVDTVPGVVVSEIK